MKHPLSITGTVIFAGSWLLLLFGTGADDYRSVISLHKLVIAHAGIVSGLALIIAGLVANGLNDLLTSRASESEQNSTGLALALGSAVTPERQIDAEELRKALAETRAKLDG